MKTITLDENVDVEMRLIRYMNAFEQLQDEHEELKQKYGDLLQLQTVHDALYIKSLNREV